MTDLLTNIVAVGETWQRWTTAAAACRDGMTDERLRELVDSRNAHVIALDAAQLAAYKAAHVPVLERSLARAARVRR